MIGVINSQQCSAQFERSLIVERTQSRLVVAKKCGVNLGRLHALKTSQIKHAKKLIENCEHH